MSNFNFLTIQALSTGLGPLLLLAFVVLPRDWANRHVEVVKRAATVATLSTLALALVCFVELAWVGRVHHVFAQFGAFQIGVYFDILSAIIFLLVASLGAVVTRFALNYLKGDPGQGYFLKWLCITIGAVMMLIVAGNLAMFFAAWVATSVSLNNLLTFYSHRPAALIAARKKFFISRLGDLCLLGAVILTHRVFGTWEFNELFTIAGRYQSTGVAMLEPRLTWLCLLLVAGAMLKSAQFPFHSWLPDSMETPTPVSALMHAGIINAGGYLLVRLSPVVSLSPASLHLLAVAGAFTALFASLVMMTQASVKRMLAFSTVAQMGFMMLQCGLGAFSIAILHIVAHSLYKAHAFLSSGSVISISKSSWVPTTRPAAHPLVLVASLVAAVALSFAAAFTFGVAPLAEPGAVVLGAIFVMALTHLLWSVWGQSLNPKLVGAGLALAITVSAAYYALHLGFKYVLAPALPHHREAAINFASLDGVLMIVIIALFGALLVLQSQLPQWNRQEWCRALYVHARNGFYFNTLANRAIQAVWPAR